MSIPRAMKLMPDYQCWCIWNADPESDWDYNIDPMTLPLSDDLRAALDAWAAAFDAGLNWDDPANSYVSPEDARAFRAEGDRLLQRLRAELPDVVWTMHPV